MGNTYYIRHFAGSDANTGLSADQAWRTLNRARISVAPGDTAYVGAGDYTLSGESKDFLGFREGSSLSPIHYIGDYDGSHTGDAGEVKTSYAAVERGWGIIENFDFCGYFQQGASYFGTIIIDAAARDPDECRVKFERCKIAERCWIDSVSTIFENCYMNYKENAGTECIYVLNNTTFHHAITLTLRHCTVIQTNTNEPNIFFAVTDLAYFYSKNNLFINFNMNPVPWSKGIYQSNTVTALITYSDYNHFEHYRALHYWVGATGWYYSDLVHWQDSTGRDTHSTEGWAHLMSFTTFFDGYKLKDISPCIGTAAGGQYDDIEGNVRDGSAPDKGCYEWQGDPISLIKTYFVRKSGNDANDGLSKENAFLTLRAATDVISQYETCYIGAGTYDEVLYMPNSGDYTQYIGDLDGNYTGDEGEVHIEAMMNVCSKEPYQLSIINHHVCLENLHFFDEYFASPFWRASVLTPGTHGCIFSKVRADKSFAMGNTHCSKIVNCVAWPMASSEPGFTAIAFAIGQTNWIYHNTFIHNTGQGPAAGSAAAIGKYGIIKNNIFVSLSENTPALDTGVGDVMNIDYNFYQYNPTIGADMHSNYADLETWQAVEGHDENALEGDPLFEADGYHIKPISPCVDMANGALLFGMAAPIDEDIDEDFRPLGAGSDIGADEVDFPPLFEENLYVKVPMANIIRFITPDYANRR